MKLKLRLVVYKDRLYVGKLILIIKEGDSRGETEFDASVMAHADIPGGKNPEPGKYRFIKMVKTDSFDEGVRDAYGPAVVIFEATDGSKNILAIHGGQPVNQSEMIPTEGGVGLLNRDLIFLIEALERAEFQTDLEVVEEKIGMVRKFTTPKLDTSRPWRQTRIPTRGSHISSSSSFIGSDITDDLFYLWLLHDYSPLDPGLQEPAFVPGGGEFGGAGATGSWEEAPAASQPVEPEVLVEEPLPVIVDPFGSQPQEQVLVEEPVVESTISSQDNYPDGGVVGGETSSSGEESSPGSLAEPSDVPY